MPKSASVPNGFANSNRSSASVELPQLKHVRRKSPTAKKELVFVKRKLMGISNSDIEDDDPDDEEEEDDDYGSDHEDYDNDEAYGNENGEIQVGAELNIVDSQTSQYNRMQRQSHNFAPAPVMQVNGLSISLTEPKINVESAATSTPEKASMPIKLNKNLDRADDNNVDSDNVSLDSEDFDNKKIEADDTHKGILSTLFSTLNIRSLTDLSGAPPAIDNELVKVRSASSETGASNVSFLPLKKRLVNSLGDGNLTLDSFPQSNDDNVSDDLKTRMSTSFKKSVTAPNENNSSFNISNNNNIGNSSNNFNKNKNKNDNSGNNGNNSIQLKSKTTFTLPDDEAEDSEMRRSKLLQRTKTLTRDKSVVSVLSDMSLNSPTEISNDKKYEFYASKLNIEIPNEKRQKQVHQLFDLPESELFLADFTCAYRRDILIHGKLYLTEHNICFHSKIIGLVTKLNIPFNKVYNIQKKKTMGIPNAIELLNLHEKYTFASIINRDQTFDLIYKVWKANANATPSDGNIDLVLGLDEDDLESIDPVSDDDYDESSDDDMIKEGDESNIRASVRADSPDNFYGLDFPGPNIHSQTNIPYTAQSGDVDIVTKTISAPVGVVYKLLFGNDVKLMTQIVKAQGNKEISEIKPFQNNKRNYQYVKPLSAPVGPKQTRCLVDEVIEHQDFDDYCLIKQTTSSPDVPSGNSFKVVTNIWLYWINNICGLKVVTRVDWSGKSWIKGAIEKNTYSGQKESLGILIDEVNKKIVALQSAGKGLEQPEKVINESPNEPIEPMPEPEVVKVAQEVIIKELGWIDWLKNQLDLKLFLIFLLFILVLRKDGHHYKADNWVNQRVLTDDIVSWEERRLQILKGLRK